MMTKHRYYIRKGVHYGTADDMIDYIDNLEAKLAKAVEALDFYACSCVIPCEQLNGSCGDVARKAIEELKGQDDE